MKKIILLALTVLMMVGCDEQNPDGSYDTSRSPMFETLVIDSCEYIRGNYKLAHKGNCRFCKERDSIKWEKRKKELEEIILSCRLSSSS